MFYKRLFLSTSFVLVSFCALAGDVEITAAKASKAANGQYSFSVTLKHGDTGWEHYADEWRVLADDGTVLGVRELLHPHVNEQPFTRSLGRVDIPAGTTSVLIDARDNVHGRISEPFKLALPE